MYKIFGIAQSRTFRVLWMLEEIGERYEHIPAKPHSSEIIKFNISGKVPVLLDGDDVLTDSSAIISYLAINTKNFRFKVVQLSEHVRMR